MSYWTSANLLPDYKKRTITSLSEMSSCFLSCAKAATLPDDMTTLMLGILLKSN